MSVNIGSMVAKITADTTGLKRGMAEARRVTKQGANDISKNVKGITKSFALMKSVMLAAAGGYAIKKIAGSFMEVAESFEAMQVKLDALTRGRGREVLEDINAWAIKMPINTQQAVQAFTTMKAMGLDPTIKSMQTLVDVSSVMGDDALPRISLALGQMRSLEKISAQDLNQLAQVGINARRYIKEAFGMGYEEVQKSGIAITKVIDTIMEKMEQEFGGSALLMMDSWRGLKLTFVSYLTEMQRAVMDAGIFEEMKKELSEVNDAMWEWWKANKAVIEQNIPEYLAKVKSSVISIAGAMKSLWDILTYDPDIIKYGLVGLLVFGKKGAVVLGGLAHMTNVIGVQVEAMSMLVNGQLTFGEVARANYQELKKLVEEGRSFTEGLYDTHTAAGAMGDALQKAHGAGFDAMDAHVKAWKDYKDALASGDGGGKDIVTTGDKTLKSNKAVVPVLTDLWATYYTEDVQMAAEASAEKAAILEDYYREQNKMSKAAADSLKTKGINEGLDDFFKEVDEAEAHLNDKFEIFKTISDETARAMQAAFADSFFDAYKGELDSLSDYTNSFFDSLMRGVSAYMGQLAATGLFGGSGSTGLFPQIGDWVTRQFSTPSSGSIEYTDNWAKFGSADFSGAGGMHLGEGVRGIGLASGKSYEFHGNEDVMPTGSGQSIVNVNVNNLPGQKATVSNKADASGIREIVIDIVSDDISNEGKAFQAFSGKTGVQPVGRLS